MRLVVTGATGHLGRSVVAGALADGHEVVALSRSGSSPIAPWGRSLPEGARLEALAADLTTDVAVDAIAAQLDGPSVVIHLAALHPPATASTTIADLRALVDVNVHGTMRVLEACRAKRAARVVYASSFEVYGEVTAEAIDEHARLAPVTDYGATKLAGEDHLRSFAYEEQTPVVALRMPAIYGPGESTPRALPNFLDAVARGVRPVIFGDGEDLRDVLHVTDAARAVLLAATNQAVGTFNVADGARHSIRDLARAAMDAAGMEGAPEVQPRQKPRRDGHMDVSRARRDLGFGPEVTLAQGAADQLVWIRADRPVG